MTPTEIILLLILLLVMVGIVVFFVSSRPNKGTRPKSLLTPDIRIVSNQELTNLKDDGPPLALATKDCIASEFKRRDHPFVILVHDRHDDTYHFFYSSSLDARGLVNFFVERHVFDDLYSPPDED